MIYYKIKCKYTVTEETDENRELGNHLNSVSCLAEVNNLLLVTSKNISPKAKKYGIIEPTNKVGDLDAVESICRR
jgi:hypothetical protein